MPQKAPQTKQTRAWYNACKRDFIEAPLAKDAKGRSVPGAMEKLYEALAEKYGVTARTITGAAYTDGWIQARKDHHKSVALMLAVADDAISSRVSPGIARVQPTPVATVDTDAATAPIDPEAWAKWNERHLTELEELHKAAVQLRKDRVAGNDITEQQLKALISARKELMVCTDAALGVRARGDGKRGPLPVPPMVGGDLTVNMVSPEGVGVLQGIAQMLRDAKPNPVPREISVDSRLVSEILAAPPMPDIVDDDDDMFGDD